MTPERGNGRSARDTLSPHLFEEFVNSLPAFCQAAEVRPHQSWLTRELVLIVVTLALSPVAGYVAAWLVWRGI